MNIGANKSYINSYCRKKNLYKGIFNYYCVFVTKYRVGMTKYKCRMIAIRARLVRFIRQRWLIGRIDNSGP